MGIIRSIKRVAKDKAGDLIPNRAENYLRSAATYTERYARNLVAPDSPREILRESVDDVRSFYRGFVDPVREQIHSGELLAVMRPGTFSMNRDEQRKARSREELGEAFRARPGSFTKTAIETTVDPLNLIGGTGSKALRRLPKVGKALGSVGAEYALPVLGAGTGELIDRALGGSGERGRIAGLLTGGIGPAAADVLPDLVRGAPKAARGVGEFIRRNPRETIGAAAGVGASEVTAPDDESTAEAWRRRAYVGVGGIVGGKLTRRGGAHGLNVMPGGTGYHGTKRPFDVPDPDKFSDDGLFGPGYYITDDPRIATSYAVSVKGGDRGYYNDNGDIIAKSKEELDSLFRDLDDAEDIAILTRARDRGLLDAAPGSNVRKVALPKNIRLFDAEETVGKQNARKIIEAWNEIEPKYDYDTGKIVKAEIFDEDIDYYGNMSGLDMYQELARHFSPQNTRHNDPFGGAGKRQANKVLSVAGFDGLRYDGGKRIPLSDENGNPITHSATVIFEDSLPKITNAIAGTPMGFIPDNFWQEHLDLAGILEGGGRALLSAARNEGVRGAIFGAGYEGFVEGDFDPESLAMGALKGAALGTVGGTVSRAMSRMPTGTSYITAGQAAKKAAREEAKLKGAREKIRIPADEPAFERIRGNVRRLTDFDAWKERYNEIVNPSNNFREAWDSMLDSYIRPGQVAEHDAGIFAEGFRKDVDQIYQGIASGAIRPGKAYEDYFNKVFDAAVDQTAKDRMLEWKFRAPVLLQHLDKLEITDPNLRAAVDRYMGAYDEILNMELQQGGRIPEKLDNYVKQVWQTPPGKKAQITSTLGGLQSHMKHRFFDDYLSGIAGGGLPRTDDLISLLSRRTAEGKRQIVMDKFMASLWESDAGIFVKKSDEAFRSAPDNYTEMDFRILERTFPTLHTDNMKRILDDLEAGDISQRKARGALRESFDPESGQGVLGLVRQKYVVRKDWARALEARFAPNDPKYEEGVGGFLSGVMSSMRTLKLSMDLAMVLRMAPAAFAQGFDVRNPLSASNYAVIGAFNDVRHGNDLEVMQRLRLASEWLPGFARPGQMGEAWDMTDEGVGKLPGIRHLEHLQFANFVPKLQARLFESLMRQHGGLDEAGQVIDREMARQIGLRVATLTGMMGPAMTGVTKNRAYWERVMVISPAWFRSSLANIKDVTRKDLQGELARRFWMNTSILGLGGAIVATDVAFRMAGQETPWEKLIDPRHEESPLNPAGRNFGNMLLPSTNLTPAGGKLNILGPYLPTARAILAPVKHGTDLAIKEGKPDSMEELLGDVGLALAFGVGSRAYDEAKRWVWGRRSIALANVIDLAINEDYRGNAIYGGNEEKWKNALQAAGYVGVGAMPIPLEQGTPFLITLFNKFGDRFGMAHIDPAFGGILDEDTRAVPEGRMSPQAGAVSGVLGFLGANARFNSQDPGEVTNPIRAFAHSKGIDPGPDALAWWQREAPKKFDRAERAAFEAANPKIREYVTTERRRLLEEQDPKLVGKKAANRYRDDRAVLDSQRRAALAEAGERFQRNEINGDQYRAERETAMRMYTGGLREAARQRLGTSDLSEASKRVQKIYGKLPPSVHEFDLAMDEYYAIQPDPKLPPHLQLETLFAARAEFIKNRGPEFEKKFHNYQEEKYRDLPVEQRYIRASRVMNERMSIPAYQGMTPDQARRVGEVIRRANDRSRIMGIPANRALMFEDGADDEAIWLASRVLRKRIKPNIDRQIFDMKHGQYLEFYTDLTQVEFRNAMATVGRTT